jgi:hypothetical protein
MVAAIRTAQGQDLFEPKVVMGVTELKCTLMYQYLRDNLASGQRKPPSPP